MIKIFRKIRQKLLSENKISKYLIYAIGEIFLVVIGILIALQINNWNDSNNFKSNTNESLISLKGELISNQKALKFNINVVKAQIRTGLNLIDSLNNNTVKVEKDLFLLKKLGDLGPLRINSLTTNSLTDFLNSGNYSKFLSSKTKNHLLVYNSKMKEVDFALERFEEFWKGIESPYLTKHFSILDMYTQDPTSSRRSQDTILIGTKILKTYNRYFSNNLEAFFNNREFASMYTSRYADLRSVLKRMYRLDNSIDDLINSITEKD
jgi:hypothetical protein